jgi:hypothetical protein
MRIKTKRKIYFLLVVALAASICSFVMKSEASLFFLFAFLALFAAGNICSIGLYKSGHLKAIEKR